MQNASKVTTGYKTILTNLMTKDLTDQFAEVGIYIDDTTTAYEKLVAMAEAYNSNPFTVDEDTGSAVGELNASATDLFNLFQDVAGY